VVARAVLLVGEFVELLECGIVCADGKGFCHSAPSVEVSHYDAFVSVAHRD
jgi:hypothetical protein